MEPSLKRILELFQELSEAGASAKLFMETTNRKQVATLTLDVNVESSTDIVQSTRIKEEKLSKTKLRKSPSTLRRDSKRLQEFRAKKNTSFSENSIPISASTPKNSKISRMPDFIEPSPVFQKQACDSSDKTGEEEKCSSNEKYVKDSWMDDLLAKMADGLDNTFDRLIQKEEEKVSEIRKVLQEANSALAKAIPFKEETIQNDAVENESVTFEDVKIWALSQKKQN